MVALTDPPTPCPFLGRALTDVLAEVSLKNSVGSTSCAAAEIPRGPWPVPPETAVVVPLKSPGRAAPAGFVLAGVNPLKRLDPDYQGFYELMASHIAGALADARAYEDQRRRAETLAELDRAKTAFFSNISHEFRTPLTLLLGPLEEILSRPPPDAQEPAADRAHDFSADDRQRLETVRRNAQRLHRLVNNLLEFSRLEAGRVQAAYAPVDLAALTADLASNFRAVAQRADLAFTVDCPPLPDAVHVDRDMWEKIVLNLLSNAFKYTFKGGITVTLRARGDHAVLAVADTGLGIPEDEVGRIFERFHRVQTAQGRTHEGSGIGLALVQELVRLHGGEVTVSSVLGQGSTFTVAVPFGCAHLPAELMAAAVAGPEKAAASARAFADEALRWMDNPGAAKVDDGNQPDVLFDGDSGPNALAKFAHDDGGRRAHILLADDNADMCQYVSRLLAPYWDVQCVSNGQEALAAARARRPDLLLTDAMMPRLDGFGLLSALRADSAMRDIPVIMLSARAGAEARVDGLKAGADDYIVKPFDARELLARIGGMLALARLRRQSSLALRQSEARFRQLFDVSVTGIIVAKFDGTVVDANHAFLNMVGRTQEDLLAGRVNWAVMTPPEFAQADARAGEQVRLAGRCELYEKQFIRKDGQRIWVLIGALKLGDADDLVMGSISDISALKQNERAIRINENRYRSLAEATSALVWTTGRDGRIVTEIPAWEAFTGQTFAEYKNNGWLNALHPDDAAAMAKIWPEHVAQRKILDAVYRLRRRDGQYRYMVSRGVPMLNENGEVAEWVGTVSDVHDATMAQLALKEAKEAAEQASQAKDQFLAVLSHELRTPLAPVLGALATLERQGELPAQVREDLRLVKRNVELEARLIDDLLDLTRIAKGKLELVRTRIDVHAALHHVVDMCHQDFADKHIAPTVALHAKRFHIQGDGARIRQIFWNLLKNAVKFTPSKGAISIVSRDAGDCIRVEVHDSGIGMDPEVIPNLFNAFEQGGTAITRQFGGLGLGLAITRTLTELHGGRVTASSAGPGKGAVFAVELPVTLNTKTGTGFQLPPPTAAAPASLRILLVEDHADTAHVMQRLLRASGHQVALAGTVARALDAALAEPFDVIVSDLGLPDGTGLDFISELRRRRPDAAPAIALTGFGMEDDVIRTQAAGFATHLTKPVDPEHLERVILATVKAPAGGESGSRGTTE